jgi:hypothetical protein
MAHTVVDQLRFTRGEWRRGLTGVTEKDASEHCGQMNSIGWIVGHLTWQEQRVLLHRRQGILMLPDIQARFAFGAPMSTPSLAEVLKAWRKVTHATDPLLDSLTTKDLLRDLPLNQRPSGQSLGSAMRRLNYHYWFHIGEIQAIRQILGHKRLPVYVGNVEGKAPYRPEK